MGKDPIPKNNNVCLHLDLKPKNKTCKKCKRLLFQYD